MIPSQDIDALFSLLERAISSLKDVNPEHELLEFAAPVMEQESWKKDIGERFLKQFDTETGLNRIEIRLEYLHALRVANGEISEETPT